MIHTYLVLLYFDIFDLLLWLLITYFGILYLQNLVQPLGQQLCWWTIEIKSPCGCEAKQILFEKQQCKPSISLVFCLQVPLDWISIYWATIIKTSVEPSHTSICLRVIVFEKLVHWFGLWAYCAIICNMKLWFSYQI